MSYDINVSVLCWTLVCDVEVLVWLDFTSLCSRMFFDVQV